MKLTTPATASEPYTAELPPVTTSTRSMRSVGIVFVSTRKSPTLPVMWRRPLTSTSVRDSPRPRRSRMLRPLVPMKRVEFAWLKVERSDGRSFRRSPTLTSPVMVSSSALIDVIGTGDSRFGRRMRDPVTTIVSLFASVAGRPDSVSTSPDVQTSFAEPSGFAHSGPGWSLDGGGAVPGVWAWAGAASPRLRAASETDEKINGVTRMVDVPSEVGFPQCMLAARNTGRRKLQFGPKSQSVPKCHLNATFRMVNVGQPTLISLRSDFAQ